MTTPFIGVQKHAQELIITDHTDVRRMNPAECGYFNLSIDIGDIENAAGIIRQWHRVLPDHRGAILLAWLLGSHLKAQLGFWPHLILQRDKPKSDEADCLRALGNIMPLRCISGQGALGYSEKRLASVARTSFPVIWQSLESCKKASQDAAVKTLRKCYHTEVVTAGRWNRNYLLSAPVLLDDSHPQWPERLALQALVLPMYTAGKKEAPADALQETPQWPMWQWLQYLCTYSHEQIDNQLFSHMQKLKSMTDHQYTDKPLQPHQAEKYAAVALAWELLCDFAGIEGDMATQGVYRALSETIIDTNREVAHAE